MIELTTEQEKQAVQLFAQGYGRSEVVRTLIDEDQDIINQLEEATDPAEFRKELSDKLRTCDPSSTRFAISKHKEHYEQHKDALAKALSNYYQGFVFRSVGQLQSSIGVVEEKIDEIDHNLESSVETSPVGASEYLSMVNTRVNLEERKMRLEDKLLERLERIHQRTTKL